MGKPFQFSIRRMCVAMALFCTAAWLMQIALRPFGNDSGGVDRIAEFVGAIMCGIAGVGAITETRIAGIVRPLIILGAVVFALVVLILLSGGR
jgi:hypothetical protein